MKIMKIIEMKMAENESENNGVMKINNESRNNIRRK
jgi:hypothetical protein